MAVDMSRKQLIKAIVLTVGVADCVGIYLVNQRLGTAVPDEVRFDQTAYVLPARADKFQTQSATFADAASSLAAPRLVARTAAAKVEGPRDSAVTKTLAALQPAAKASPPSAASANVAVITPHLARIERSEAGLRTSGARIASASETASLALDHVAPAKASVRPASAKSATSLAGLVPRSRTSSEFTSAFAGFDSPLAANVPLENTAAPHDGPSDGAVDFAQKQSASPTLEVTLPEAVAAPEPMTATIDTPGATL